MLDHPAPYNATIAAELRRKTAGRPARAKDSSALPAGDCRVTMPTPAFVWLRQYLAHWTTGMSTNNHTTTQWLQELTAGDRQHLPQLTDRVYGELKRIAVGQLSGETPGHTLQPTALVHEAFLRLIDQQRVQWQGRSHFLALSAQMMRRILVDHARAKRRQKRGGGRQRISLEDELALSKQASEDVLSVDEALTTLAEVDPLQAKIVEMRFFGGMTVDEVAEAIGSSKRQVERQWTAIRAWLRRELAGKDDA